MTPEQVPISEQIQAEIDRRRAEHARKKWAKHDRRLGRVAYPSYVRLVWMNPKAGKNEQK